MERTLAVLAGSALLFASGVVNAASSPPTEATPTAAALWLGNPGDVVATGDPYVERAQRVIPNVTGLAYAPDFVNLTTSDGATFKFRRREFDARSGIDFDDAGNIIVDPDPKRLSYYWYGVDGYASATITVSAGAMHATVTGSAHRLAVIRDRRGVDVLQTLNVALLNRVACHSASASATTEALPSVDVVSKGGKPDLDMLSDDDALSATAAARPKYAVELGVVFHYTPDALAAVSASNDPSVIAGIADAAIDQLRTALQNTGQAIHIRPVRVGPPVPIAYDESPSELNPGPRFEAHRRFLLQRWNYDATFPTPGDGIDILNSRTDFGGDMLVMLVADQGNPGPTGPTGPFGLALVQRRNCDANNQLSNRECDIGPAYRDFAFAAVSVQRASTDFTLAHEVGHMMGSEHDRAGTMGIDWVDWTNSPGPFDVIASYASSYGYRTAAGSSAGRVSDVMGSPPCIPAMSTTCWTRQLQFADPSRSFMNTSAPAGEQTPSSSNQGYGFNSRSFRLLAEDLASFYGGTVARPLFWNGFE